MLNILLILALLFFLVGTALLLLGSKVHGRYFDWDRHLPGVRPSRIENGREYYSARITKVKPRGWKALAIPRICPSGAEWVISNMYLCGLIFFYEWLVVTQRPFLLTGCAGLLLAYVGNYCMITFHQFIGRFGHKTLWLFLICSVGVDMAGMVGIFHGLFVSKDSIDTILFLIAWTVIIAIQWRVATPIYPRLVQALDMLFQFWLLVTSIWGLWSLLRQSFPFVLPPPSWLRWPLLLIHTFEIFVLTFIPVATYKFLLAVRTSWEELRE